MRQQTFLGYIKWYLRDVSALNTLSVRKLAEESKRNLRIRDALALYCVFTDKTDAFTRYTGISLENLNPSNYLEADPRQFSFAKILESYRAKKTAPEVDADTKARMRANILAMMDEKGITNYRLYTDLGLNPGNANAFLKHGDTKKMSMGNVKRMFFYAYHGGLSD